jgi:hypothetical protein
MTLPIIITQNKLLMIAILLGIIFRLYQFGSQPISLNRDEAALGYNAYSLSKWGVDEWGVKWPVIFVSFGDYKLPGYIYTLVPLVSLFGPDDWVIRLPSLIAGLVIIYLGYLMAYELTRKKKVSLLVAATIALTPWAIYYSRMAFEAHLALMFLVITIYWLIRPFTLKRVILSAITYLLAIFTYNTPLLLAPVLVGMVCVTKKQTWRQKGVKIGMISVLAGFSLLAFSPLISQKQNITIFSDPTIQAQIRDGYVHTTTIIDKLIHHRVTYELWLMGQRYLASFSPNFLVFHGGGHPWHSIPQWGHFTLTSYILALLGIGLAGWQVIKQRKLTPQFWILLTALLPAIITVDAPHATRSLLFFFILGLMMIYPMLKWSKFIPMVVVFLMIEASVYAYRYFYLFPGSMPTSWPTGIEAAIKNAARIEVPNQLVTITNPTNIKDDMLTNQIYIYALLYSQSKSDLILNEVPRDSAGMVRVAKVDNFRFTNDRATMPGSSLVIERDPSGRYNLNK